MRWSYQDCGQWRKWFAWYPVVVFEQLVWLEVIERRFSETFCGERWLYRAIATTSTSNAPL